MNPATTHHTPGETDATIIAYQPGEEIVVGTCSLESDARLCAAAPTLLAACEAAHEVFASPHMHGAEAYRKMRHTLIAAIRMAHGRPAEGLPS